MEEFLEARLGMRALIMLGLRGASTLPSRGTMLLKAWSARRFTLLFRSVSLGLKASKTCQERHHRQSTELRKPSLG